MVSLLLPLLTNKLFWAIVVSALGAITFFWKGYSAGKKNVLEQSRDALDKLKADVKQTEAKNQADNTQREKDVQAVNRTSAISDLISMWNALNKKDRDPKA